MDAALCLSGYYRDCEMGDGFRDFPGDVFVAIWDRADYLSDVRVTEDQVRWRFDATAVGLESFSDVFPQHQARCEKIAPFRKLDTTHKNRTGANSYSQFYLMDRAGALMRAHERLRGRKYDVVVQFRPDYVYRGLRLDLVDDDCLYFPQNSNFNGMTDALVYGRSGPMYWFQTLYQMMDIYLLAHGCPWINEHLACHHVRQGGLSWKTVPGFTYRNANGTPPGGDQPPVGW